MMEAYAYLCCRQIEAVALYKELYKTDRKFQAFIKVNKEERINDRLPF